VVDGRGFINNTNWQNILSVQGNNNPSRTRSSFAAGSRITAFLSHTFDYSKNASTSVSNNEVSDISQSAGFSDLIFVPASPADINLVDIDGGATAAQQWAALDEFIENDSYLSSRRGDFAEANQSRTPFEHILDLKIAQDFKHWICSTLPTS